MDIVKKNLFSIVCGVIAIVAIVASFWPVDGEITTLQTDTQTHAADYTAATSLISKSRHLPLLDPAQTTPQDLTVFPNAKVIEEGKAATAQIDTDSVTMLSNVVEMNRLANPLLVADALPAPLTESPRFRFRDLYKVVLGSDPAMGLATDPNGPPNLQNDILHAGMPPTQAEVTAAAAKLYVDEFQAKVIFVNGQPVNQADVTARYTERVAKLPDVMRRAVADSKKMYIEPNALTISPNVAGQAAAPAPVDIWFAQLGLWVQENACAGIALANAEATNVMNAPVKRLVSLGAAGNYTMNGPPTAPTPVEGGDTIAVPKVTTLSPTGRVCNPLYDVVQFTMTIDVDVAKIPAILAALSRNRLVDVYGIDMAVVDNADQQLRGYIYGTTPVVTLNLKCEALFMRAWEAPLMPDLVKTKLGVTVAAATVAPGVVK